MAVPSIPIAAVTSTGITVPDYATILAALQGALQSIYGSDIDLDPDTQDGQLISVFAQAVYDQNQLCVSIYNQFSPSTAQGAGLSSVVKINGLQRNVATDSQAVVTIVGQAGTQIISGTVGDNLNLGTQWQLPDIVTIPPGGSIDETATCTQPGSTIAAPGTLTQIITPTLGWQTVTNAAAATPGSPVETDATLRQRQSVSTSQAALTPLEAIYAAIANIAGVSRLAVYENDTDGTDGNGIPSHSISAVVEGGDVTAVAEAIAAKKSPGTGTYGSTSEVVIDSHGVPNTIRFFELALVTLTVAVTIKALQGYVSTTGTAVAATVAAFVTGLSIGEDSYLSRLYAPANLSGDIAVSTTGQTQAQLDALSATYHVLVITQSRTSAPINTTVTGGPYSAGSTSVNVASASDIYAGAQIVLTRDDASLQTVTVTGVSGLVVSFTPGVGAGRSVPTGANVYLGSDVQIVFKEAAICASTNVTVTVI